MLVKLSNFIRGSVTIQIRGAHCEHILNVFHRNGGNFRKLYKCEDESICITIGEGDLELLKEICQRYYAEIEIIKHSSFRKFFSYWSKRKGLMLGCVVGAVLLIGCNCFVWDIQVSGCDEKTTVTEIKREFDELGLGIGTFRFGLDFTQMENQFMLNNDEVIWVSVNMRFTTAHIEIKEKTGKEIEILDLNTPCDIYAARDGQIVSMMVSNGTALVSEGDSVCAGEKLVSREYLDRHGETIVVHSIATVTAKTKRVLTYSVPLTETVHIPSGNKESFLTLNLFNLKIPLYFNEEISYNNYDRTEKESRLKIGKNYALPFSIFKETYTEVTYEQREIDQQQAKLTALAAIEKQEKEQLVQTEILSKTVKEEVVGGYLVVTAEYHCLEDIALTMGD